MDDAVVPGRFETGDFGEFQDGSVQEIDLGFAPGLQVLQHRGSVSLGTGKDDLAQDIVQKFCENTFREMRVG